MSPSAECGGVRQFGLAFQMAQECRIPWSHVRDCSTAGVYGITGDGVAVCTDESNSRHA